MSVLLYISYSSVTIPEVALTKHKQNCWVGRVWISEELLKQSIMDPKLNLISIQ
jgi:hypothetical protein